MKKRYLFGFFGLASLSLAVEGLDRTAEFPGLPWHQPDQKILITSVDENRTRIFETATKREAILECPRDEVREIYQLQFPTMLPNGHGFFCASTRGSPATSFRSGVGEVKGLVTQPS